MIYNQDSELLQFPEGNFTIIAKFVLNSYERTKTVASWRNPESMDSLAGWYIDVAQDGRIEAGFGDGLGGSSKVKSNYVPRIGYPCIVVWTSEGHDFKLWADGNFIGLGHRFDSPLNGSMLYLGSDPYFPTCNFNGEILSLEILEGAFSSERIKEIEI